MQTTERGRRLLAIEDGERLFLLVANKRGVKVVRVTVTVEEEGPVTSMPWYMCKVWMHAPASTTTGHMDILMLDAKVESCAVPSEEAAFGACGRYLPVLADVPTPEGGGVVIHLRIDKEVKASRSPCSRGGSLTCQLHFLILTCQLRFLIPYLNYKYTHTHTHTHTHIYIYTMDRHWRFGSALVVVIQGWTFGLVGL